MKCFLLSVTTNEDSASDERAEYALVAIDKEVAKKILARKELFQMAKAKDPEMRQMSFADRYCYFYTPAAGEAVEEVLGGEQEMHDFISEGVREVDESFALDDELQARTDNDLMVVTEDGFSWTAVDHYGSEVYGTQELAFDVLLPLM